MHLHTQHTRVCVVHDHAKSIGTICRLQPSMASYKWKETRSSSVPWGWVSQLVCLGGLTGMRACGEEHPSTVLTQCFISRCGQKKGCLKVWIKGVLCCLPASSPHHKCAFHIWLIVYFRYSQGDNQELPSQVVTLIFIICKKINLPKQFRSPNPYCQRIPLSKPRK